MVRQTGSRIAWVRHGVRTRSSCVRERGNGGWILSFLGNEELRTILAVPVLGRNRQMFFTCQVQYLNDVDPFSYPTLYPDVNPPNHTFSVTLPLINQLAAVHRLLGAPHRVSYYFRPIILPLFGAELNKCLNHKCVLYAKKLRNYLSPSFWWEILEIC